MQISRSSMMQLAEKIDAKQVKLNTKGTALTSAKKTTEPQNAAVLAKLREMLNSHYSPEIADRALRHVFNVDLEDDFDLNTAVRTNGIKGFDIVDVIDKADDLRAEFIVAHENDQPAEVNRLIMARMEDEIQWPKSLTSSQREQVRQATSAVVAEFAQVHGISADSVVTLIGQRLADEAETLRANKQPERIGQMLNTFRDKLIDDITRDAVEAAWNGDHTLGNMTRTLAPKLQNELGDHAAAERTHRFGLVQKFVASLDKTTVTVTRDGTAAKVSLRDIFNPETRVWANLNLKDRESAVRAMMKLHATTHQYPDKLFLDLQGDSNSVSRIADKQFALNLTPQTTENDDATQMFRILTHELTHAYQRSVVNGTNGAAKKVPNPVKQRLAYDTQTRIFQHNDHVVKDFAQAQDFYVRDMVERMAVESEWLAAKLFDGETQPISEWVAQADKIGDGMAGQIRSESWGRSFDVQKALVHEVDDNPSLLLKRQSDAISTALELGVNQDNDYFLQEADTLLKAVDIQNCSRADIAKFSGRIVDALERLFARARATPEEKTFAREHLSHFHQLLFDHSNDADLKSEIAGKAALNCEELLKTNTPAAKAAVLIAGKTEMAAFKRTTEGGVLGKLAEGAQEIAALFAQPQTKATQTTALAALARIEAKTEPFDHRNKSMAAHWSQLEQARQTITNAATTE